MTGGTVVNVAPGKSVVRLTSGEVVVARNLLNVRTPPKARVTVVKTTRGWAVVGRER